MRRARHRTYGIPETNPSWRQHRAVLEMIESYEGPSLGGDAGSDPKSHTPAEWLDAAEHWDRVAAAWNEIPYRRYESECAGHMARRCRNRARGLTDWQAYEEAKGAAK